MKPECKDVLKEIELYLDAELGESRCGEIRRHLEDCPPCLDRADFRKEVRDLIARKCGCEDVPETLIERIRIEIVEIQASE